MKLTNRLLKRLVENELKSMQEEDAPATDGPVKGTLDVKKIAETLGVDPSALSTAVSAAKKGALSAGHKSVLADVFVALMKAGPEDTTKVMNVLKKVEVEQQE